MIMDCSGGKMSMFCLDGWGVVGGPAQASLAKGDWPDED